MSSCFEFDVNGEVASALAVLPDIYINERLQEYDGTRYGAIIRETAMLALCKPITEETHHWKNAFIAGATMTLEALDHSSMEEFDRTTAKRATIFRGLPETLLKYDPRTAREHILVSSRIGNEMHPELRQIKKSIFEYYYEKTGIESIVAPVFLGVGRMAFVIDKCVEAKRINDPRFDLARTIEETIWDKVTPEDITG